jgi:RNA 2',3'-cyclic 3'-phosphodiesterase
MSAGSPEEHLTRVFFAALPERRTLRELETALQGLPPGLGRRVPVGNLHLTLAFVGGVVGEGLACLREKAQRLDTPDIDMSLMHLGCFNRAGVLWLGPDGVPAGLSALARELAGVLAECGIVAETRAFSPHVTLARRVRRHVPDGLKLPPVVWRSHGFALMESVSGEHGVCYRIVERYRSHG